MDRDYLYNGPENAPVTIILAHGAGAAMDTPFMEHIAGGIGEAGYRVVRFEFPYMQKSRATGARRPPDAVKVLSEIWRLIISEFGDTDRVIIGGKSMGGRIASMIADEAGVAGLVCLGYPFHAPGKSASDRTAHLASIKTPTLILQGTRDQLGLSKDIDTYDLSVAISVQYIEDGDHSYTPRQSSGRTREQNLTDAVAAIVRFVEAVTA